MPRAVHGPLAGGPGPARPAPRPSAMVRARTTVAALAALAGCEPRRPPPPAVATDVVALTPAVPPRASPPSPSPAPPDAAVPSRGLAVRAVAALRRDQVLAITTAGLQRFDGARWVPIPVTGVELRDVTAARGALWLLARGAGAQAGRTLVLRARGDDLALAADLGVLPGHDPRALAVATVREVWIAGASPTLVRAQLGLRQELVDVGMAGGPADAVRATADEVVAARLPGGRWALWRWGGNQVLGEPWVGVAAGAPVAMLVRRDGALVRARPGERRAPGARPERPWLPPSGLTPAWAVALGDDGAVEVASDGRGVVWSDRAWAPVASPATEVAAVLATGGGGALLVARDGGVFALDGRRWARLGP